MGKRSQGVGVSINAKNIFVDTMTPRNPRKFEPMKINIHMVYDEGDDEVRVTTASENTLPTPSGQYCK